MTRLTDDQRRAVELRGADLCVVAGAGTGKTHVLTERVVRRVEEGLELRRLLAITFTEKAAAQMKARLAAALQEQGRADAWEEVERAAISTVHAFCARLLREHAVEAGLDPGFAVLDEIAAARLLREALDALVHELAATRSPDLAVLADLPGEEPDETLLSIYRAARESVYELADFARHPEAVPGEADPEGVLAGAIAELRDLEAVGTPKTREKVQAVLLAAEPGGDTHAARFRRAEAVRAATHLGVVKEVKPAMEAVRDAAKEAVAQLAEGLLEPARQCLARTLLRLDALYDAAKGAGERLDFADLERRAVALLRQRPSVADAVRNRWSEVLVDEFQDTNPVQSALVELIRPPRALFVVGDPKQAIYGFRGSDVSVFLETRRRVRADDARGEVLLRHSFRSRPDLLGALNVLFASGFAAGPGEAVEYQPLVAGRSFAEKSDPCVEAVAVPCESLPAGRRAEAAWIAERIVALTGGADGVAPLAVSDPSDDDPLATRPARCGDVAILLRATTHVKVVERALTGCGIPYLVVKGRGFHAAREVVDLANLLGAVDQPLDDVRFAATLRSPACGLSDDGLFVLCAARKRGPDESVALAEVVQAWSAGTLRIADLEPSDERALRGFAEVFAELRAVRSVEPLTALVERALASTGLELLALGQPGGRQRAANLRKVVSQARTRDLAGEGDLAAFVAEMRELRVREVRETEAPVAAAAIGAVSILTVHASKGLEFPIVFVPDLARGSPGASGNALVHHTDGLGLGLPASARGITDVKPWSYSWIKERNEERAAAEGDRLLYVAVTRAEEHLLLSTAHNPARGKPGPWWARVSTAFGLDEGPGVRDVGPGADEAETTRARVLVHAPPVGDGAPDRATEILLFKAARELRSGGAPQDDVPPEAVAAARALLDEAAREIPAPVGTLYATTVSALITFARSPEEFHRRHVLGLPETLSLLPPGRGGDEDAEFGIVERPGDDDEPALVGATVEARAEGRAVHAALERLVPEFDEDIEDTVRQALAFETSGAPVDPAQVRRLVRWVEGFRDSDIGREARAVPRAQLRREQAFLFNSSSCRTVVRGQLDLVYRSPQGWVVVDYKAGRFETPGEAHDLQMRLYALGVQAVTGEAPERLILFSLPLSRAIEVRCNDADLAALEAGLLADFARRTEVGDYSSRAEPGAGGYQNR